MRSYSPLRVDWLLGPAEEGGQPLIDAPGRIGLSSCPGRIDVSGDVEEDVALLISINTGTVVSLVSDSEMALYGVLGLRSAVRMSGLRSIQFVIEDKLPPTDLKATQALCTTLLRLLGEGENILLHCIGGWGRSGTIAACLLTHQGYDAEAAVALVRQARSPRCVETSSQFAFVRNYAHARQQATGLQRFFHLAPRTQVAQLVTGERAARQLTSVPSSALLSATTLAERVAQSVVGRPGAERGDAHLVVLSGEAAPIASSADAALSGLPLDRAFVYDGQRWRAIAFSELLRRSV